MPGRKFVEFSHWELLTSQSRHFGADRIGRLIRPPPILSILSQLTRFISYSKHFGTVTGQQILKVFQMFALHVENGTHKSHCIMCCVLSVLKLVELIFANGPWTKIATHIENCFWMKIANVSNANIDWLLFAVKYRKSFHSGRGYYSFFDLIGAGSIQGCR